MPNPRPVDPEPRLQRLLDEVIGAVLARFAPSDLTTHQLAVTLVALSGPSVRRAGFRNDVPFYPASIVKMFFLAAAHAALEQGKLADTAHLREALRAMVVNSSNDATHYIVDLLTGTTSGPELPEAEMPAWGEKRETVNRYFRALGYAGINLNQKTWNDAPYGRDRVWLGPDRANRNFLTTEATARLLCEIVSGECVSAPRSRDILNLLARDRAQTLPKPDRQALEYTALGLPPDAKLWSKAGWTSEVRHDAAYVEMKDGRKFVLVTFTTGHVRQPEIIGTVARGVVERL